MAELGPSAVLGLEPRVPGRHSALPDLSSDVTPSGALLGILDYVKALITVSTISIYLFVHSFILWLLTDASPVPGLNAAVNKSGKFPALKELPSSGSVFV